MKMSRWIMIFSVILSTSFICCRHSSSNGGYYYPYEHLPDPNGGGDGKPDPDMPDNIDLGTIEQPGENFTINGVSCGKTGMVLVCGSEVSVVGNADYCRPYTDTTFRPGRTVRLSPYSIGQYEVTQEFYAAVLASDTECNKTPSSFKNITPIFDGEENKYRPVEKVTWYDAVYFCNSLTKLVMNESDCVYVITDIQRDAGKHITSANVTQNISKKGYRLPTQAEWEYAARGGSRADETIFKYEFSGMPAKPSLTSSTSSDVNLDQVAWYKDNSSNKPHEVGLKRPNKLGCYDMNGNVCEWCWDYAGNITTGDVLNPTGPTSAGTHIRRGGSYSGTAGYCSNSTIAVLTPDGIQNYMGFRLACTE